MSRKPGLAVVILTGGLVAATIDIAAACLISGRSVPFILHTIAGGLLAGKAYSGGLTTAVLGFLLQELMGVIIAAIYVIAGRALPVLTQRWRTAGLAYGVVIFFVMNYVVVPLSAWKHLAHFSTVKFLENMAAMLLFGLIVAYFAQLGTRR